MKKELVIMTTLCMLTLLCTGCGSAARKQAAYEAGKAQASSQIQRVESESLDESSLEGNLGMKAAEKREENKDINKVNDSSGGGSGATGGEITYIVDTLNSRVHLHNSGCSLLGKEDGRSTLENWTGTLDEAVAYGYTKCPECILKIY